MTTSINLSLVVIAKNDNKNLAKCLASAYILADEVIIFGGGDGVKQIAESFGAKWHPQDFTQNLHACDLIKGRWILVLKANECIDAKMQDDIRRTILQSSNAKLNTIYSMRCLSYIGTHCVDNRYFGLKTHWRLYPAHFGNVVAKKSISNGANTAMLAGFCHKFCAQNHTDWLHAQFLSAKNWADSHTKSTGFLSVVCAPLWVFFRQYVLSGRFLLGWQGLFYAALLAQYTFNKYAISYDKTHNKADEALLRAKNMPISTLSTPKQYASLVMITKNEARHLADCLTRVRNLVDDIVILDSGSSDDTKNIAQNFGARWYENTDWQGFGAQRQLAQKYAKNAWILVLDADERLDDALRQSIWQVLNTKNSAQNTVYALGRANLFCGHHAQKPMLYRDYLARLYPSGFDYNDNLVHESLDTKDARVVRLKGTLVHLTNDNLAHFIQKNIRYSRDWADGKTKNVSALAVFLHALVSFLREYILRAGILGGAYGYILAAASMSYTFNKYLMRHMDNQ